MSSKRSGLIFMPANIKASILNSHSRKRGGRSPGDEWDLSSITLVSDSSAFGLCGLPR